MKLELESKFTFSDSIGLNLQITRLIKYTMKNDDDDEDMEDADTVNFEVFFLMFRVMLVQASFSI